MTDMARIVYRPEPSWVEMLNAVRTFIAENAGRYPAAASTDPREAKLGSWWVSQRMAANRERLSANRDAALTDTVRLAREVAAEAKRLAREQTAAARRAGSRRAVTAAARRQIRLAERMLDSPHLLPGDREALELRIAHPRASIRELAELAGATVPAYGAKLRGALSRTARSQPAR